MSYELEIACVWENEKRVFSLTEEAAKVFEYQTPTSQIIYIVHTVDFDIATGPIARLHYVVFPLTGQE